MNNNTDEDLLSQQKYAIDPVVFKELENAIFEENVAELKIIFSKITLFDTIDFLISTRLEYRKYFLAQLVEEIDPMIFVEVDDDFFDTLINMLETEQLVDLLRRLDKENLIYAINRFNEDNREKLIPLFPRFLQLEIYQNLNYPEESAGRLANKNFIVVLSSWTIEDTLDFFERKQKHITEKIHQIFIVDNKMRPLGYCDLCDIMFLARDTIIDSVMNTEIKTVSTEIEQEEVAHILRKYGLLSIPVVNHNGVMVGIISYIDIVDVIQEEAVEDTLYLGGVSENDIHFGIFKTINKRFPWLAINMCLASLTAIMIGLFDHLIEKAVFLAVLLPVISSTGGNSGLQTVTVMIKSLANRDITKQNVWRIFCKEIIAGVCTGILLAILSSILVFILFHRIFISMLFGFAIILVFFISNFLATCVPLLLNFIKIDPAISSSIIITTITDISAVLIFLGLATKILL